MKFLCVSCNAQMKLVKTHGTTTPDSKGSLSIRYECPACLVEIAMLTNAFETQLVTSLGVEIGEKTVQNEPETASACPFSAQARTALNLNPSEQSSKNAIKWTAQAQVRLQNIPEFVRPMAVQGIEKFAADHGFSMVDEKCLDQAKEEFGM